jgi:hypothetical protein
MIDAPTYCEIHPDRETSLRCNKCGRLMCTDCAVPTPVGYRCKQCVRQHEDKFFNASEADYIIIFAICAGLTGLGAAIVSALNLPIFIFLLLGLPLGGGVVAEAALRATKRRRGRYSPHIAVAGVIIGGLAGGIVRVLLLYNSLMSEAAAQLPPGSVLPSLSIGDVLPSIFSDLGLLIFIGIVAAAVYGRFRMRI